MSSEVETPEELEGSYATGFLDFARNVMWEPLRVEARSEYDNFLA